MSERKIRLGLMGFGLIGRQLYQLAMDSDDIEIVAISDIGKPEILHYLLSSGSEELADQLSLEGNYLVNPKFRTRMMQADTPAEVPWDLSDVDCVVDATGKFQSQAAMNDHLGNGAKRVILSTLPDDHIDRLILAGINEGDAQVEDEMISAGSATTTAFALVLKILGAKMDIETASMTSVHAYTSDQPLQDYAGKDFRRSRSAAENIIPNTTASAPWIETVMPEFAGKLSAYALNVPVQKGSLLDLTIVFKDKNVSADDVNAVMMEAQQAMPNLIDTSEDPIVSSDVIGNQHSLLFDMKGTLKGGGRMIKTLSWYESLGHASRILDLVRQYNDLDKKQGDAA